MDIERFDGLYPTPAHAAAADLSDRYAPQTPIIRPRRFRRDRAGAISVVVGLVAAMFGGAAYVMDRGIQNVPHQAVYADVPPRVAHVVVQQPAPALAVTSSLADRSAQSARRLAISLKSELAKSVKSRKPGQGSSKWIADSLSGDALAAALIVDHRRTVEMNAEQLRLMAEDRAKTSTKALPFITVPSDL